MRLGWCTVRLGAERGHLQGLPKIVAVGASTTDGSPIGWYAGARESPTEA